MRLFLCLAAVLVIADITFGENLPVNLMPSQASMEKINSQANIKIMGDRFPIIDESSLSVENQVIVKYDSEPKGADLYINGENYGKLPLNISYSVDSDALKFGISSIEKTEAVWERNIKITGPTAINLHRGNRQKFIFVMSESITHSKLDAITRKNKENEIDKRKNIHN